MGAQALWRRTRGAAAAVILGGAGCDSPTEVPYTDVAVRVQTSVAFAGDSVSLHLINNAAYAMSMDGCPRELQRLGPSGWRAVPIQVCSQVGFTIDGGEPIVTGFRIPPAAAGGHYRMLFDSYVPLPEGWLGIPRRIEVHSNVFYVRTVLSK